MTHEMIIGIAAAVGVAVIFGIKTLVHRVLAFKMDESAIVKYIVESSGESDFLSIESISAGTDISASRVAVVCTKSRLIKSESTGLFRALGSTQPASRRQHG